MIAYVPLLICLVGLLIWALAPKAAPSASPVLAEVGRWMFIIGLFWTVAAFTGKTVKVL